MLPEDGYREEVCLCTHIRRSFNSLSLSLSPLRALEVWGSWQVLEYELKLRRHLAEERERRRKGLGALMAQLKKSYKTQVRKEIDKEVGCSVCVCVCVCVCVRMCVYIAVHIL